MGVKIYIHPNWQHLTNGMEVVEVKGSTVGQCLDHLVKQFPVIKEWLFGKDGKLLNYIDIYVNLESAFPEELAKPVKDGDELYIIFLFGGG